MNRLSDEYISTCRVDRGKILRGENMSRIETFVDAAFAFAFTMLVISIDQIPTNPEELLELSRDIPAFLISAIIIGSIWVTHANWSRHFGLQDSATLYLSLALVMLVLVFVYPIKLMAQASVLYSSGDALGTDIFVLGGWDDNQVAILFIYFGLWINRTVCDSRRAVLKRTALPQRTPASPSRGFLLQKSLPNLDCRGHGCRSLLHHSVRFLRQ